MYNDIPVTLQEDEAFEQLITKDILWLNAEKTQITVDEDTWNDMFWNLY